MHNYTREVEDNKTQKHTVFVSSEDTISRKIEDLVIKLIFLHWQIRSFSYEWIILCCGFIQFNILSCLSNEEVFFRLYEEMTQKKIFSNTLKI